MTFKFKVTRYFAWPSISPAVLVLSERSRCLFPHNEGQGSQRWYSKYCESNGWPSNSRSRAISRDLSYLWLYSCYQKDLGVYFHIIEIADHNNDIINTATVTVDLQIQGHMLFLWPFISWSVCKLSDLEFEGQPLLLQYLLYHNRDPRPQKCGNRHWDLSDSTSTTRDKNGYAK